MPGTRAAVKRAVLGRPRASRELGHQLLPKWMALPVFSSDPMSSVAYATQEMMLVLALAGAGAFALVQPLSAAVALLMAIVIFSYRQTVRAYPHGGGAYIVAKDNLGERAGLSAGAALLIDYTLTVSVSIAAGVAAIVSAFPALAGHRVLMALGLVAVVTLANLRGVREAGALFAVPTYLFVATILLLIATGAARCVGGCPQAPSAGTAVAAEHGLTLFLVLRAFASGATALTGVEAISNGVGAFRYPQSRNAAATLAIMGALAITMFLGISALATATGVVAYEGAPRTVVAEIALAVFGAGPLFLLVQLVTAAILVLAANTAYADFPRLSAVLAADRYLPRQLTARGDRLVFSNGILILALVASALLVVFGAEVTRLIQLYVVGVFTSFTLSQSGMVRRHLRLREPGWRGAAAINLAGAMTTGLVLVVVAITKFTHGAWVVLIGIPLLATAMLLVNRHYRWVSAALRSDLADPLPPRPTHAVILLDRVDEAAARALSYARATGAASVEALGVPGAGADLERRWAELAPGVPLQVLGPVDEPGMAKRLRRALHERVVDRPGEFVTAIAPETLSRSWREVVREHRFALRVKAALLSEPGLIVVTLTSPPGGPGPYTVEEPVAHHVLVLVSDVNTAVNRALAYGRSLQPTTLTALSVNLSTEHTRLLLEKWADWGIDVELELLDSPYRALLPTVVERVRELRPDGRGTVCTVILPEFVLRRWYQQPLHNQTALHLKAALLLERGVVTTSVPYLIPSGPAVEADAGSAPTAS